MYILGALGEVLKVSPASFQPQAMAQQLDNAVSSRQLDGGPRIRQKARDGWRPAAWKEGPILGVSTEVARGVEACMLLSLFG